MPKTVTKVQPKCHQNSCSLLASLPRKGSLQQTDLKQNFVVLLYFMLFVWTLGLESVLLVIGIAVTHPGRAIVTGLQPNWHLGEQQMILVWHGAPSFWGVDRGLCPHIHAIQWSHSHEKKRPMDPNIATIELKWSSSPRFSSEISLSPIKYFKKTAERAILLSCIFILKVKVDIPSIQTNSIIQVCSCPQKKKQSSELS